MQIQPIVIGTAGHIDHGKSSLVRALTGIDPDRLKEEKERGMTIDLGFACMELPDGRKVGIIDVPGHERFIRNMVAGASGIDLVVLVVAADDGVMPQTREHLSIMQLLGVKRGLVALTKVDVVDPDMAELAAEDVRDAVRGTFLEDAPILPVSSTVGTGLEDLRGKLMEMAAGAEPRPAEGVFRMPIQRVFSARGFGTILTGIPVTGSVQVGDVLEALPSAQKGKVRGIQAYHERAESARAGHSTALNLADVDHHRVERGHVVVTPGFFKPARMVGARLTALADLERPIVNRMRVRVHTGTSEAVGEVVLLDEEELAPGAGALVQFRLEQPLVCAPGDRFVMRLASPVVTLGGGVVLEESRHRLKRFKSFVIEELSRQHESLSSLEELLESHLRRADSVWVPLDELAVAIKRDRRDTQQYLESLAQRDRVRELGSAGRWIHTDALERELAKLELVVEGWFAKNPLRHVVDVRELRSASSLEPGLLSALLDVEAERGKLALEAGGKVRPAGRAVELDARTGEIRAAFLAALERARFQPPSVAELCAAAQAPLDEAQPVLAMLVDEGAVVHVGGDLYLAGSAAEEARSAIVENCERNGHLEIPELRDRLGTTRKFLIPLLEFFDAQGLTLRQAGHRVLKRR